MAHETLVNAYLAGASFNQEKSRLQMAGTDVAFHCDKFNTRVLKNFEDVMGYEEGGQLLFEVAERTTHDAMTHFLLQGPEAAYFRGLDLHGKLEAIFELFKVLGYGAIDVVEATPQKAVFRSASSYLAAGWLENRDRWHLDDREGPACHDVRGHLAAAMSIATGADPKSFSLKEKQCRAYKDGAVCEFVAEVK